MNKPFVVVVVATFRRAPELKRLLDSLEPTPTPRAVVVVDNAGDPETAEVVCAAPAHLQVTHVVPGRNLGCGGGLAFGERVAFDRFGDRLTHLWILDDDVEVAPGALERLLAAMETHSAALACPMITGGNGEIGWFPGLLDRAAFKAVRETRIPAEFLARCGAAPVGFSWATGVALLVTRTALEQHGFHRADFWIRGEDLEFSLRITARSPGIFVPDATVAHLPRPAPAGVGADDAEREKHRVMLQNIAYISLRLPHGRRILRTLPGNLRRFVKTWGMGSFPEAIGALWKGRSLPAGAQSSPK